jgi:hypothetical protein
MSTHHPSPDDLALYVLGALSSLAGEMHLVECSDCRHEAYELQKELASVVLSTEGPPVPSSCRKRLLHAIAKISRSGR